MTFHWAGCSFRPGLWCHGEPGVRAAVGGGAERSGLSGVCLAGIFQAAPSFRLCLPGRISRSGGAGDGLSVRDSVTASEG